MGDVVLCNISDANQIIEEERFKWIINVLLAAGIPEDILIFDDIRNFRADMYDLGIEVELINNKEVNVYKLEWLENDYEQGFLPPTEENLIAQWKVPKRVMKIDENGRDAYYEIHLDEWSMFKMGTL